MSTTEKELYIYQNLPSGGAKATYISTFKYLSNKYRIFKLVEPKYRIKNLLDYLYIALLKSPNTQKHLANKNSSGTLLCYQTWLGNSPSILRYFHNNVIYVCHEPPREFYDKHYIISQTLKERVVNLIRFPLKMLDKYNVMRKSIIIVVNSKFSKRWIDLVYGVNSRVVYPGINLKVFNKSEYVNKRNQIISIGSINVLKNQLFLVKILSLVPQNIRPKLVLISNGSDLKYLKRLHEEARKFKVDIKVLSNISEREKVIELKKSIIFIYSPINEPFGLSLIEGIASGLPIVVYGKGGGYREVISSKNGLIIDNLSPIDWAVKLGNLLKNNSRLRRYRDYNLSHSKKYSEEVMNMKIESILLEENI